ncbi:MAG: elongation factor P [Fimbriimonadaceae bacterium]|nr:elongation factor P [Fimbriimonadaceae bacterium]QYK57152.1 MAG: elongation factor P [Fimbriimonadaceae bacterium]
MDGEPYQIIEFQHVKPGKGGAFVRTKLKRLKTGNTLERTFRSGEKFDPCFLERKDFQFLFKTGTEITLMDMDSYEQIGVEESRIGDGARFLKEEAGVTALVADGETLGYELPNFVELQVTEAEPGVRGDTASGGVTKGATVETGADVQVPMHIAVGDVIKIDTRTGEYLERVSRK